MNAAGFPESMECSIKEKYRWGVWSVAITLELAKEVIAQFLPDVTLFKEVEIYDGKIFEWAYYPMLKSELNTIGIDR